MKAVFIVDENAPGLSTDLNAIANREKLDIRFYPLSTPEQLFRELEKRTPDLILLHHHWPGLSIAQLLDRVVNVGSETRIIVFTGQSLDIVELIACVRFGVVDYWTQRGSLDPVVVVRKILNYCSSPWWTLERLRMPSGSLQQLLEQAENAVERTNVLVRSRDELQVSLTALRSQENRAVWKAVGTVIKFVCNTAALTAAFIVVDRYSNMPTWGDLGFIAIVALFFLILEGKVTEFLLKWQGGSAKLKTK